MYRVKIITKDKKHIFISETKNIKLAETCYNTIERIMHDKNITLTQAREIIKRTFDVKEAQL